MKNTKRKRRKPAGPKKTIIELATCYRFIGGSKVRESGEAISPGTFVSCGETRSAKNGESRLTILLVQVSVTDAYTRDFAWVRDGALA